MLNARRLEIFCAVAEEGSFTAASGRLNLTQSAVSQQVSILEDDLGFALVERVPRGIKLTVAGKFLAERARTVLRELTGLQQELRRVAIPQKIIKLGVFATAGAHLVPMVVQKYRQQFPDTQLILHSSHPEDLASELKEGEIDAGITWDYDFLPRQLGDLVRQPLLNDPLCLLLARDHPLAAQPGPVRLVDFAGESWVVRTHHTPLYEESFETMCRIAGFEPKIAFRAEDYQSVQGLVAANIGVAVVPRLSMVAQRPDVVIREITEPSFGRRIDAVTLARSRDNPLVAQLLAMLGSLWTNDRSTPRVSIV